MRCVPLRTSASSSLQDLAVCRIHSLALSSCCHWLEQGEVWGFLDEINTCEYLGAINDLLCHRSFNGKPLHHNVVLMACANPYEKRIAKEQTAGLQSKFRWDKFADLTYRVHPLPESMLDYVWDYGALRKEDEREYIRTIFQETAENAADLKLLVDLVAESQQFVRLQDDGHGKKYESHSVVSIRDVKRMRDLISFNVELFHTRTTRGGGHKVMCRCCAKVVALPQDSDKCPRCNKTALGDSKPKLKESQRLRSRRNILTEHQRAYVLALSFCYHARLHTATQRAEYWENMRIIFAKHRTRRDATVDAALFDELVRREQEDILCRMDFELFPNIAHNGARPHKPPCTLWQLTHISLASLAPSLTRSPVSCCCLLRRCTPRERVCCIHLHPEESASVHRGQAWQLQESCVAAPQHQHAWVGLQGRITEALSRSQCRGFSGI